MVPPMVAMHDSGSDPGLAAAGAGAATAAVLAPTASARVANPAARAPRRFDMDGSFRPAGRICWTPAVVRRHRLRADPSAVAPSSAELLGAVANVRLGSALKSESSARPSKRHRLMAQFEDLVRRSTVGRDVTVALRDRHSPPPTLGTNAAHIRFTTQGLAGRRGDAGAAPKRLSDL